MYYFLNESVIQLASGLEHAEFKRIQLFNQFKVPAKIVTVAYSAMTRTNNNFWHLSEENFVNLYDFYAGTEHFEAKKLGLNQLAIARENYRLEKQPGCARFWDGQRQVAEVHYINQDTELVSTVDYYDGDAQKIRTDVYDERGFLAYAKFWATGDNVSEAYLALEQFYTLTGRPYLEITYRHRDNNVVSTNYRLLTADGAIQSYMNQAQLIAKFYDDLNTRDNFRSTFISDRTAVVNYPMTLMQTPARKIECLHSIHFSSYRKPFDEELVYPSLGLTDRLSRTDMVITSTPQQADDIKERLRTRIPIVNIPVGVVDEQRLNAEQIPMIGSGRIRGKIVEVARLYSEKNLSEAILAFKAAHDQLDWLTFDIYGYGDATDGFKEEHHLRELVQQLNLQDCVQFKGYTNDIGAVYQQAQLMLLTSRLEGFALALLEANSYGVPAISYDTYYGPAYIIHNDESGYVVPYDDRAAMTAKIVAVMTDPEKLQALSTGAYARAHDFSAAEVWKLWQTKVIETDPALDLIN